VGEEPLPGHRAQLQDAGLIGCGNIGSIVAERVIGLKMRVIAYDPFLSEERATELGVEKVTLEQLLPRADFITVHTPLTEQTKNILSRANLMKTKKGVRVINCARGGLVDELAVRDLLVSGHLAGAGFDVFVEEPAKTNVLFGAPNLVCTPHLGASTLEAQENVRVAGRRADVGLPADRRGRELAQHAQRLGRGRAQARAVSRPCPEARLVRRPAHRQRHQGGVDRVRGPGGGA
jgi:D-3-phosphoglycerate dehydrogenase